MSWYLADADEILGPFASVHGIIALRKACGGYPALRIFFEQGATKNISACIAGLNAIAGHSEESADIKSSAADLGTLMKGQSAVWITDGTDDHAQFEESLKHPKHAEALQPIRAKAAHALKRFFRAQKRALLKQIKPNLRSMREADDDAKDKAARIIPDQLPPSITRGIGFDYAGALRSALSAGYESIDVDASPELAEDVVQTYLSDHSLTRLTGDFDATSVDRLRNALADAYRSGANYDGLVKAVQDEYAGFNDVRAGMIAQTEMNAAYNAGRKQLGLDMGFNEKAWDPDGTACPEICIPNVLDGWIPIEEDFESGDDAPPGHPNCDCSLSVRFNPHLEEAMKTLVPVYFSREEINQLRESARLSEGWVTLDGGEHVFIGSDGKVYGGSAAHERSQAGMKQVFSKTTQSGKTVVVTHHPVNGLSAKIDGQEVGAPEIARLSKPRIIGGVTYTHNLGQVALTAGEEQQISRAVNQHQAEYTKSYMDRADRVAQRNEDVSRATAFPGSTREQ